MNLVLPVLLVALIVLMVVQLARQRKSMKSIQEVQATLAPGDRVMTTSGLHGTVVTTAADTVVLEVAPGVQTTWDVRVIRERVGPAATGAADPDSTA